MEQTTRKVILTVGFAVIVGLFGYFIKGILGMLLGFIGTLLVVGLFSIWRKNE